MDKTNTKNVERDLLLYFASVGALAGRVFTLRDFNTQVMMNAYTAADRAGLHLALSALIKADILLELSVTEYSLTTKGLLLAAESAKAKRTAGITTASIS